MIRKGTKIACLICGTSLAAGAVGFAVANTKGVKLSSTNANEPEYELRFDSTKRISNNTSSYVVEESANAATTSGNNITINASNVIKYNDGWQTILPNGYFYNPVSASGFNNKISGIKSVTYTSDSNNSLSLYYGYSLNNTEIIYSLKETITSGVELTFSEEHPSYIYLQNDNNSSVNVNTLSIKYSCSEETYPRQDLNILMIGNSFSDDTVFYASRVADSYGINLNIYDAYIASCTIDQHYSNLSNNSASYSMRTIVNDEWSYTNSMTLSQILATQTWDIITFQQASSGAGRSDSYSNLGSLVNLVKTTIGYTPKIMWYQTWAYDHDYSESADYFSYFGNNQTTMYNAINTCYQNQVASLGVFDKMIPAGTAVQNMRTTYMQDRLTRDGKHMSPVHGRYLLALNFLSGAYGIDLGKSPCGYLPEGMNSAYRNVATECVQNAIKTPLAVTNSAYTSSDIAQYDLSTYTEIDAGLVGCSYWDATDSTNYNIRIQNVKDHSNHSVSTNRFTSSTLPVGSIISIDEPFGVQLQTWTSDAAQAGTMATSFNNIIEVNSSFWSGYTYRAFNIFKSGMPELKGQYDQIFDGFHIYVPNASLGDLKVKSVNYSYDSDKIVMRSILYNIDAYERIHLDPIIGFYKCDSYYDLTNSYVDDTAKKFICTRPFYNGEDLPENTIIIVDSGYQWRSDCWGESGTHTRPGNVADNATVLDASFWTDLRRRTFNVSSTSSSYVGQNALAFMDHLRIYIPVGSDITIEPEDTATFAGLGNATLTSMAAKLYGKSNIPIVVTLTGDDTTHVKILADGAELVTTKYVFNKSTGQLTIDTEGSIDEGGTFTLGQISGILNRSQGILSNVAATGSVSGYLTNNGSISITEKWFDACNYASDSASQLVWQRWYMTNSWQANSGTGQWTTTNSTYKLDGDHSMGLRIADKSYGKTKFSLKQDFNGGSGLAAKGITVWIFNPNPNTYKNLKIFLYTTASTMSGDHAQTSGNYITINVNSELTQNQWVCIQSGYNAATIYNVALYFETTSSATTYLYVGRISFY